jgi:hypothetical protein
MLFQANGIQFITEGKNVGSALLSVQCPFCDDHSYHCGVFEEGNFSCWRCSEKGGFYKLVKELIGMSYGEFNLFLGEAAMSSSPIRLPVKEKKQYEDVVWPVCSKEINGDLHPLLESFLEKRSFTVEDCKKYEARFCRVGEYALRLIIPVFYKKKLVSFQGRDVTGRAKEKYMSAISDIKSYLYDYDFLEGDRIIITEGVFDVWRIGTGATCTFGTQMTDRQSELVVKYRPKEVIFAWDGDAYIKAKKQAKQLLPLVDKVKVLRLPEGEDPDSLGKERLLDLIESTKYL